MSNVIAIAQKELKGYFASPIAYVVIGMYALMFGFFFYAYVMGSSNAPQLNINEQLVRPVFLNAMVIFLFVLPMVTMRTYSEEKRSGTIELLLTAPLTDFQIIMGKFLGAMGLYAAMLAVTLIHIGLLISSLTKNQIVAVMATFTVFLMLWVINWIASFMGPTTQTVLNYLSITDHLDDFTKGILDTKHLVYYVSFIAFGLFLTARSVDTERWRG